MENPTLRKRQKTDRYLASRTLRQKVAHVATEIFSLLVVFMLMDSSLVYAQHNPGHDELYVNLEGDTMYGNLSMINGSYDRGLRIGESAAIYGWLGWNLANNIFQIGTAGNSYDISVLGGYAQGRTTFFANGNVSISGHIATDGSFYGQGTGLTGTASSLSAGDLSCTNCIGGTEVDESALSGTASSLTSGDVSCTGCIGGTEVDESSLSGTASSLTAGDLSCTDCVGDTEV
ncbi:hypothetical protein JXB02_06740, partial [Candidatus Woesearchaeota archaeon]|nr:hypothetical protein [Candidatus Woesearchaeota archaeon]